MNTAKYFLLGLELLFPVAGWSQPVKHLWATPSQAEADLQRLEERRDRALAAATMPIQRQYAAALEQLLRVTMQRGDLDGAVKIKKAILEASGAIDAIPVGATEMPSASLGDPIGAKRFAGTVWIRARIKLTFGADGSFKDVYGRDTLLDGTWKALSPTEAVASSTNGRKKEAFKWESAQKISRSDQVFSPGSATVTPPPKATPNSSEQGGADAPTGKRPFGEK